jgi:septal ring factor EnvC (AmiA/AmiB activator)
MRKFLISVALVTAASIAVPASAQRSDHRQGWSQPAPRNAERQIQRDLDRIEERIDRAQDRRRIHPREAFQLRREVAQIRQSFWRDSRRGLSQRQFVELRQRIDRLEQRLRHAERRR